MGTIPTVMAQQRMGGRAVEGTGLENRRTFTRIVGSNPTPSALLLLEVAFASASCKGYEFSATAKLGVVFDI